MPWLSRERMEEMSEEHAEVWGGTPARWVPMSIFMKI